jgi:hypothetical protein
MRRETEWRSMYSDMSKRWSGMPSKVRELARDFRLADAGGAGEQIVADRLVRIAQTRARQLDRGAEHLDRLVLPEDDALQILLEVASTVLSSLDTVLGGMRAMVEMTCSISFGLMIFLRLEGGTSICIAPTSSITSIALSGSLRSLM